MTPFRGGAYLDDGRVRQRDGLPFEKVVRNIIRARFTRPGIRPYKTQNIYAPFAGKEEPIADQTKNQKRPRKGR